MNKSAPGRLRGPRSALMTERACLAGLACLSLLLAGCKINLSDSGPPGPRIPPGYLPVSQIVLSPDGKVAAFVNVGSNGRLTHVRVSDVATGHLITTVTDRGGVDGAALSPGGKLLATLDVNGSTDLRDTATGQLIATLADPRGLNGESGQTAAFSPDGKILALADAGGSIALWDLVSRRPAGSFVYPGTGSIAGIAFSPDGKTLAIFDHSNHAYLTTVPGGAEIAALTIPFRSGGAVAVAFSPDGKTLATVQDQSTCLWDIATGLRTACLTDLRGAVLGVAYSPDDKSLADFDYGRLYLWNTATRHLITTRTSPGIRVLEFSADGKTLTAIYGNGSTRQWKTT